MSPSLRSTSSSVGVKTNYLPFDLVDVRGVDLPSLLIREFIEGDNPIHLCTINAEIGYWCLNNVNSPILKSVSYWVPDGIGISLVSKWIFGIPCGKIPGIVLAEELIKVSSEVGLKVAMFGSTPSTLEKAVSFIQRKYTGCDLCAAMDGYCGVEGMIEFRELCKKHDASLILVACGHPLQDQLIIDLKKEISAIFVGVGGSFDVWSGSKRRAPGVVQRLGVEWAYRIAQDPSPQRLGRSIALPLFVLKCIKIRILEILGMHAFV